MSADLNKLLAGYQRFQTKYAKGEASLMHELGTKGQSPQTMVIACSDSRVDPAVILQCDPGDLFVVRSVANIVPAYQKGQVDSTSAALEFGINFLKVKRLILLGHSECGGIAFLLKQAQQPQTDFLGSWTALAADQPMQTTDVNAGVKGALMQSFQRCLTFPWIKDKIDQSTLTIHQWYFDITQGQLFEYQAKSQSYELI